MEISLRDYIAVNVLPDDIFWQCHGEDDDNKEVTSQIKTAYKIADIMLKVREE